MSLWSEIIIDKNGFVALTGQDSSDNGLLYTSEFFILLSRNSETARIAGWLTYSHIIDQCFRNGNPCRRPGNLDQEGPDDLIGIAAASKALKTGHAAIMLAYGRSTRLPFIPFFPGYIYNTPKPGKFTMNAWMGRMPGLIGHIRNCAGEKMNALNWAGIILGVLITVARPPEETSDRLLTELIVRSLPDTVLGRLVQRYWDTHIRQVYGSINSVVVFYFGNCHPFARYWV